MSKVLRIVLLVALSAFQLSCSSFFYNYPGEKVELSTEVTFLSPDGTPLVNERVYILEIVGNLQVVMKELRTNSKGGVVLSGRYCAPIEVGVGGGSVVIHAESWKAEYVVTTSRTHPPLKYGYGYPDPEAEKLRESAEYCWNRGG